jgi:hypothetical protein
MNFAYNCENKLIGNFRLETGLSLQNTTFNKKRSVLMLRDIYETTKVCTRYFDPKICQMFLYFEFYAHFKL